MVPIMMIRLIIVPFCALLLMAPGLLGQGLVINEFMADNDITIQEEDISSIIEAMIREG